MENLEVKKMIENLKEIRSRSYYMRECIKELLEYLKDYLPEKEFEFYLNDHYEFYEKHYEEIIARTFEIEESQPKEP